VIAGTKASLGGLSVESFVGLKQLSLPAFPGRTDIEEISSLPAGSGKQAEIGHRYTKHPVEGAPGGALAICCPPRTLWRGLGCGTSILKEECILIRRLGHI